MKADAFRMEMWRNLFRIKYCMEKIMDPVTQPEGLTPLQALVLLAIRNRQVCNIRALCDATQITQSNASTLCKKLEQAGFLYRVRSKADERVVTLSVTPAGCGALERILNRLHFIDGVLEQAGPEKLDALLAGADATIEVLALLERAAPDIQAQRLPQTDKPGPTTAG